jgi:AsmA protein
MGRIVKLVGLVAAAVLVLFVTVMLGLSLLVDPNDYKDEIAAAVERATGRELTLAGDLELEVFPRLRIAVGEATLGNAQGFGDQPFARIGSARLQLALLPLLSRRVEIGEARLEGLVLNLARNAAGRNNWQDMGEAGEQAAADTAEDRGERAAFNLNVDVIEVVNAEVNWNDAATGGRWQLRDFNMTASSFGPETSFPLRIAFGLRGDQLELAVDARARALLSLVDNDYRLEQLDVRLTGSGEAWPGGQGDARLRFDSFAANLGDETLALENLQIEMLGMSARGTLSGRQLMSNLSLNGAIEIAEFSPRNLLGRLGVAVDTADSGVLSRASASANFVYDPARIALRDMRLALDDSTLTGEVGVEREVLRFNLAVDDINIDRYLPPDSEAPASADEGSLDEVDLPIDVFRTLQAGGELRLARAQFLGLRLTDATFTLNAANGRVVLAPRAALYGGSLAGEVRIEVQGNAARIALTQELANVDMLPLARDFVDSEMVSGTGGLRLNLSATGSNVGEIRRVLAGDVSFTLRDGAWEGVDMWYELRRARAVLDGNPAPAREGARRTPFSLVSATGVIADAVLTNRDLSGTLPFMAVTGRGTVNMLSDAMDFDLVARMVDGPTLQSDPGLAGLAGRELPLRVGGTLTEPSVRPDFGAVLRSRAEDEVRERVEEEREEVRERLQDRLRGIFNR